MARARTGELEAAVMDVLWNTADWLTPGDVHAVVSRDRDLAYNTVMTILVRLWQKGRVERQRDGRAFAYRAVETHEAWAAARMDEVLAEVADRPAALSLLLDRLSRSDRAQLRRLLGGNPTRRRGS
jgi:predicted transcriptional regulator